MYFENVRQWQGTADALTTHIPHPELSQKKRQGILGLVFDSRSKLEGRKVKNQARFDKK